MKKLLQYKAFNKIEKQGIRKVYLVIGVFLFSFISKAQQIDFGTIGKGRAFKIGGGISANSVFYSSNQENSREPFTYFLQGSLNVSLYEFSMPISYSITNQGSNLDYQLPFNFNRLSLHPKYKWVQAHIGDVNMSFSPYTLNGHQFTGGGLELTPKGGVVFSAAAGRFLKAVEDDGDPQTIPAYKRMGYGAKVGYKVGNYEIGLIGFYARDEVNSIALVPEDRNVLPKENLVVSIEGTYKILKGMKLRVEYASTAITQDLRTEPDSDNKEGLAGLFFKGRASTEYYNAVNTGVDYSFGKSSVGLGYERIDPGYETLGAFYFNNDFENVTLNGSTRLLKDKLDLGFNIGYQRDDLEDQKGNNTNRTVGAVNASFDASEKLNISASYSNFTTFTNAKLNQFETINDDNLLDDDLDTLDYKQLSQNANLNINYILSKKENLQQKVMLNYSLADVTNEQGGMVRIGDASTFHNIRTSYLLGFPEHRMNITTALNVTRNTIGRDDATTWGPTMGVNKRFFENTLNTSLMASYNSSKGISSNTNVTSLRARAGYVLKENHNFNLSATQVFKSLATGNSSDLTITFGYNYTLGKLPKFRKREKVEKEKTTKVFNFSYKDHYFEGEHESISPQVVAVSKEGQFNHLLMVKGIMENLTFLEKAMIGEEGSSDKKYERTAIDYLRYLYDHKDFLDTYNDLAFKGLKKLYTEAVEMNYVVEKEYFALQAKVNSADTENEKDIAELKMKEKRYVAHTYMMEQLRTIHFDDILNDNPPFKTFKDKHISKVFTMLENGKDREEIHTYLEIQFADFYHKRALEIKTKKE